MEGNKKERGIYDLLDLNEEIKKYGFESLDDYEACLQMLSDKYFDVADIRWQDIRDDFGINIHPDTLRKASQTPFGGAFVAEYYKQMKASADGDVQRLYELENATQKYRDARASCMEAYRTRTRLEELKECIMEAAAALPHQMKGYTGCKSAPVASNDDSKILISLTDIHYGIEINNAWNTYNPEICAARLGDYLERIKEIRSRHGSAGAVVWINGDLISGSIHKRISLANKENVTKQIIGVSELIARFLTDLVDECGFETVEVASVAGNHSRLDKKDDAPSDERLDDLVEWWLRPRLKEYQEITFDDYLKLDTSLYTINVCGKTYAGVHGDYDPASNLSRLYDLLGQKPYAVLSGHMHHNKVETIQGVEFVMAGSLSGMDDYCVSKRILSYPQQMVCVCNSNGIVCTYPITF